jgi:hypothetical protein
MRRARLVSYGNKAGAHWAQGQCEQCGAWLTPMPERHEQHPGDAGWDYIWICVRCGEEHRRHDSIAPERWSEDAGVSYHQPGSRPPEPVRNPEGWDAAERLSVAEKALVHDCWTMVDSLSGSLTIHKVTYVWDIERALEAQDLAGLVAAATEYVNLLDYEAIHGKETFTYYGDEGDVTAIRADLDRIPLARELRAGRASPWRPQ